MKITRSIIIPAIVVAVAFTAHSQPKIPDSCKTGGFAIGSQAYTFRLFSAFEAIEKTAQAGGKVIEFYPGQKLSKEGPEAQVHHNASDEVIARLKAKLAQHNIKAVNYGVVNSGSPDEWRKIFEFAQKMGMVAITTESAEAINTIEQLVKEFDICVGFHNHPGNMGNPKYKVWNPLYIAGLVTGRDPRIGAAADTGHWCTSKLNPVEGLRILRGRLISCHLKDKKDFGPSHDVPYGQGVANIKACLDELKAQGFAGNISIEYEDKWENNVPEVTQCIDFVRDYGN